MRKSTSVDRALQSGADDRRRRLRTQVARAFAPPLPVKEALGGANLGRSFNMEGSTRFNCEASLRIELGPSAFIRRASE